jgi:hypothetical protein
MGAVGPRPQEAIALLRRGRAGGESAGWGRSGPRPAPPMAPPTTRGRGRCLRRAAGSGRCARGPFLWREPGVSPRLSVLFLRVQKFPSERLCGATFPLPRLCLEEVPRLIYSPRLFLPGSGACVLSRARRSGGGWERMGASRPWGPPCTVCTPGGAAGGPRGGTEPDSHGRLRRRAGGGQSETPPPAGRRIARPRCFLMSTHPPLVSPVQVQS